MFVADTSSLSEIRRITALGIKGERKVFAKLDALVDQGIFVYPPQVVEELKERGENDEHFLPYHWAKAHKKQACRFGRLAGITKELMAHPQVRGVVDRQKAFGTDEADPYVLALGAHLKRDGYEVVVLSEERRDRLEKLSMNTACGLLRLYCLPVAAFLIEQGFASPAE